MSRIFLPAGGTLDDARSGTTHIVTYTTTDGDLSSEIRVVWTHPHQAEAHAKYLREIVGISRVTVRHSMCGKGE